MSEHRPRHFAFIRAINVGKARLTNEQLLEPFRALGFLDVAAYQAAGNVTFRPGGPAGVDADLMAATLSEAYGFETVVFVRTRSELEGVLDAVPFDDRQLAATEGRVQVTFLGGEPDPEAVAAAHQLVPAEDLVEFVGAHWYWLPRAGVSGSLLPVSQVEKVIGPMTMRTLGTVSRMVSRFD